MFELIGKDGEFSTEVVHLAMGVEPLELTFSLSGPGLITEIILNVCTMLIYKSYEWKKFETRMFFFPYRRWSKI